MSDQTTFFEGFYVHFLLHDLYGKIIPGGIVLMSLQTAKDPTFSEVSRVLSNQYSIGWIFIIGIAWIIGFSLQVITNQWSKKYEISKDRYLLRIKFFRCANQFERSQLQRYVLVVDATGNAGRAFLISVVVIIVSNLGVYSTFFPSNWEAIVTLLLLSAALLVVSKRFVRKQEPYMEEVVAFHQQQEPSAAPEKC